jgi:hypothetical protein
VADVKCLLRSCFVVRLSGLERTWNAAVLIIT